MPQIPPLIDTKVLRPAETALALGLTNDLELLRLKALARWYARGLPPDVTWEDLLQEALTRIIVGARRVRDAVPTVAFVAGIMRSLRSEHWRRVERAQSRHRRLARDSDKAPRDRTELVDPAAGPERVLMAQQELAAIRSLFADDPTIIAVLNGLAQGLSAADIRLATGLSEIEYASARKQMRRVLLREGLTCEPKR